MLSWFCLKLSLWLYYECPLTMLFDERNAHSVLMRSTRVSCCFCWRGIPFRKQSPCIPLQIYLGSRRETEITWGSLLFASSTDDFFHRDTAPRFYYDPTRTLSASGASRKCAFAWHGLTVLDSWRWESIYGKDALNALLLTEILKLSNNLLSVSKCNVTVAVEAHRAYLSLPLSLLLPIVATLNTTL